MERALEHLHVLRCIYAVIIDKTVEQGAAAAERNQPHMGFTTDSDLGLRGGAALQRCDKET